MCDSCHLNRQTADVKGEELSLRRQANRVQKRSKGQSHKLGYGQYQSECMDKTKGLVCMWKHLTILHKLLMENKIKILGLAVLSGHVRWRDNTYPPFHPFIQNNLQVGLNPIKTVPTVVFWKSWDINIHIIWPLTLPNEIPIFLFS